MKTYRGVVVQRCYINVTVEVEDDTPISDVNELMQLRADFAKGDWESEALDIEEIPHELIGD